MIEDEEKHTGPSPESIATHEIGQSLDTLSVSEIEDRIEILKSEIVRLEETRRFKQDSQAAASAFFKF